MRSNTIYNRTMYHLIREQYIIRSPILSMYFKTVFMRHDVKYKMDLANKKMGRTICD